MTIIYSFLFCGLVCLVGEIILNNTNLTPGHITSLFVVIGSIIGITDIYNNIVDIVGMGASLPIVSFGNLLTNNVYSGFLDFGFLGLFKGIFTGTSLGISSAVIFSFIFTLFFNPKD